MRLLMLTFDPPQNVGGVEGRAVHYTRELLSMGHFVEVIALAPDYNFASERTGGAVLHKLPSSVRKLPSTFGFIVSTISRRSIDTVFLLSGSLTVLGALVLVFGRIRGLRTLVFFYGKDILSARGTPLSLLTGVVGVLSRRIAANSSFTASLLPPWARNRARILYPGVDPGITSGILRERRAPTKKVLFVGRLVRRKGLDTLLVAFRSLLDKLPDCQLEIVGDGPEREAVASTIARLGLASSVKLMGTLRGTPLYERFANADLFVMPSRAMPRDVEGFGTVFLEAGLFCVPVIGTFSGGIPEAVVDGVTGYLVHEDHPDELCQKMSELLSNPSLSRRMGEAGRARALQRFTWERVTSDLFQALRD